MKETQLALSGPDSSARFNYKWVDSSTPEWTRSIPPIQSKLLARLHKALRECIPALANGTQLSSVSMDREWAEAMKASSVPQFKEHYFNANVLKRYIGADLSDPVAREARAVEKLLESEARCAVSNEQLYDLFNRSWLHALPGVRSKLLRAKKILHDILGEFDWEEFPRACNFSPGATVEWPKVQAQLHNKWASSAYVTRNARPYVHAFRAWCGDVVSGSSWGDYSPDLICDYNVVFTVPKNFERDRTACKPVTWNGFFQKGVGKMIRRRLNRKKLLLPDAQEFHQVLAKIGSRTGALSTLDLSGASDGISLSLIEALLPRSWYRVIADLREEFGKLPSGEFVTWEKVSTMGNGFTFELETALFYALAAASCSRGSLVTLYGDDFIVPTKHVDSVVETMVVCGFEFNREKTFTAGLFRESCGGHYYDGVDVKPFYIKNLPNGFSEVINLHNDIVRWIGDWPRPDHRFFRVWRICREIVPRKAWGPPGKTGVLWAEWDDCRPVYISAKQAFVVHGCARVTRTWIDDSHIGSYLQNLWEKGEEIDDTNHSSYRETGTSERWCKLYVDRVQWKRLTAETLCT